MTTRLLDIPQGSPAWHEARRTRYGASELAPIGGIQTYQRAGEVWARKCGAPVEERQRDLWQRIGHALEPLALELAAETLGSLTLRGAVLQQADGMLLASLDAAVDASTPEPIDAKVRGKGSDDHAVYSRGAIPVSTMLQLLQQSALVAELTGRWPEAAHVTAILADAWGWEHRTFRLALDAERRDYWRDLWAGYAPRWHRAYVLPRRPPPDATTADIGVLVEVGKVTQREATAEERGLLAALVEAEAARREADRIAREATKARDLARDDLARSLGTTAVVPGVRWASRRNLSPLLTLEKP